MKDNQKETISYLMDGGIVDSAFIDDLSHNEELSATWKRYHLTREIIKHSSEESIYSIDVTEAVAKSLCFEEPKAVVQKENTPNKLNLFWAKVSHGFGKVTQVGLAAGVTLMIISGVQNFNSSNSNDTVSPILNPNPMGVSVTPVGGIEKTNSSIEIDDEQYNKIKFLTQEYELIRRLNAF